MLTAVSQIHFLVPSSAVSFCNSLFWIIIIHFFLWVRRYVVRQRIFLILYILEGNKNGKFNTLNRVKRFYDSPLFRTLKRSKKEIEAYQKVSSEWWSDFGEQDARPTWDANIGRPFVGARNEKPKG